MTNCLCNSAIGVAGHIYFQIYQTAFKLYIIGNNILHSIDQHDGLDSVVIYSIFISILGKPSSNYDKNNPDWAPTLNMGHSKIRDKSSVAIARSARINKRKEMKKRVNDANILLSFHKHASSTSESESSNSEQGS